MGLTVGLMSVSVIWVRRAMLRIMFAVGFSKVHAPLLLNILIEATRVQAIALRVEAIALRVEASALGVEAIAARLKDIATRLEAITTIFDSNLSFDSNL